MNKSYGQAVPNALVVAAVFTDSFMRDDLHILGQFTNPIPFEFYRWKTRKGKLWGIARAIYNILLFTLWLVTRDVRVIFFWFAATNYGPIMAALARLLRRRVIVITGGIDAVYVSDIHRGAMKSRWHRLNFGIMMRLSDCVLPFSDASRDTITASYHPRRIETLYPPVDTGFYTLGPGPRHPRVVTCCYEYGAAAIVQKGLQSFVETAALLPEAEFVVVGNALDRAARDLQDHTPANVRFVPRIPSRTGYREFLQQSSVYAQLSAHEGFGVSLAESMACGCIPVVTDRYALPEVVGETGFVVPYRDHKAAADAIRQGLAVGIEGRERASARSATRFDQSIRAAYLFELVAGFLPQLRQRAVGSELR